MTLEEKRDATMARIIEAGGVIAGYTPLAHPDAPEVVLAYRINAGAPSPDVAAALAVIREETETDEVGLVPAVLASPEEVPEV